MEVTEHFVVAELSPALRLDPLRHAEAGFNRTRRDDNCEYERSWRGGGGGGAAKRAFLLFATAVSMALALCAATANLPTKSKGVEGGRARGWRGGGGRALMITLSRLRCTRKAAQMACSRQRCTSAKNLRIIIGAAAVGRWGGRGSGHSLEGEGIGTCRHAGTHTRHQLPGTTVHGNLQ